ncbi:MAG: 3-phosphoshikimate 1-carboxyvinyltransferase [Candidatus Marinimicrobia bacterium]|nr:3-phosphoshikimate 1-carboxyvinyltransferase [Candidatus Neomarinimicrobiota bacterium]|tara:strand:- start:387 stop:1634 length:1248 start_codon:yes stop_codon:yes gene_type:complete
MVIKGGISFPGDKSISHRALMLASIADGDSRISNLSTGEDIQSTRVCLESCGIKINEDDGIVVVTGGKFSDPDQPLNCGNSGTTTRLLIGLLAGQGINATFTGDKSLRARPMNRILNPLSQMQLRSKSDGGRLPVTIYKSMIKGINYKSPIASAQIKSALIFAGLGARSNTSITEPILSRNHTEKMLKVLGVNLFTDGFVTTVSRLKSPLRNFNLNVPADPSTCAFFAAAVALVPGSNIIIDRILWNPTRNGFFSVIDKMGVGIEYIDQWEEAGERIAKLNVFFKSLKGINITKKQIPTLIDELPIIAILATQAEGKTVVSGAEELRFKECDRINAICLNLKRMGADIKELQDGFIINGPKELVGNKIKTFDDHRIAMAFTIAGLISRGDVVIDNQECVSISFPEFFNELSRLKK